KELLNFSRFLIELNQVPKEIKKKLKLYNFNHLKIVTLSRSKIFNASGKVVN
ncbi:hypothetical protein LCGC14_2766980, partial [marine sediment metagenome]